MKKIMVALSGLGLVIGCPDAPYNRQDLFLWKKFYDATSMMHGTFCSGPEVKNDPCCTCNKKEHPDVWVHCVIEDGEKYIESIHMKNNNLYGVVPDAIVKLEQLDTMVLSGNPGLKPENCVDVERFCWDIHKCELCEEDDEACESRFFCPPSEEKKEKETEEYEYEYEEEKVEISKAKVEEEEEIEEELEEMDKEEEEEEEYEAEMKEIEEEEKEMEKVEETERISEVEVDVEPDTSEKKENNSESSFFWLLSALVGVILFGAWKYKKEHNLTSNSFRFDEEGRSLKERVDSGLGFLQEKAKSISFALREEPKPEEFKSNFPQEETTGAFDALLQRNAELESGFDDEYADLIPQGYKSRII